VEGATTGGALEGNGCVQSRINVANGRTKTTPLRANGEPVSAGFEHVIDGHFDLPVANNRSVFNITPADLKTVLQSNKVVSSPETRPAALVPASRLAAAKEMKIYKENDIITLTKPTEGEVIGDGRKVVLPIGTVATVVLVHGDLNQPMAYEIEAYVLEQDCYVLATVEISDT